MPDYKITIHLKTGGIKQGIRWHAAHDPLTVRAIVEKIVLETMGKTNIGQVDVAPTALSGEGVKSLLPQA